MSEMVPPRPAELLKQNKRLQALKLQGRGGFFIDKPKTITDMANTIRRICWTSAGYSLFAAALLCVLLAAECGEGMTPQRELALTALLGGGGFAAFALAIKCLAKGIGDEEPDQSRNQTQRYDGRTD